MRSALTVAVGLTLCLLVAGCDKDKGGSSGAASASAAASSQPVTVVPPTGGGANVIEGCVTECRPKLDSKPGAPITAAYKACFEACKARGGK